jgi:hypothetical protein
MPDELKKLIELASAVPMSASHREEQRRSFAYGNTHFENPMISREMIDREAEKLRQKKNKSHER